MKNFNSRKGSALLIVLGMLTFLIVSAVGFATYMRYGRLPSSQLRRTVSGRQLVKAAVARAIDEIDQAINNNPHPNVGELKVDLDGDGVAENRNIWYGRVYMGTNIQDSTGQYKVSYQETVSPLCLEALAYIPPALVNEARYYSRLTPTAQWKTFDFEAGRYAFMALDVSDFFDVNRLFAYKRRSSAPNQRISLSYLFEKYSSDADHNGLGEGADKWDDFMKDFREVKADTGEISFNNMYPLISLADFNLALGEAGIGGFISPFCRYVNNNGNNANGFYNLGDPEADEKLKRMTFVTDGLFPKTNRENDSSNSGNKGKSAGKIYDVADANTQPFDPAILQETEPDSKALEATINLQNRFGDAKNLWVEYLGAIGCVTLFDYLDADKVPLSIALPTVERTPMICGVQARFGENPFKIKRYPEPGKNDDSDLNVVVPEAGNGQRTVEKEIRYEIDSEFFTGDWKVGALTVFPFARDDEQGSFTIDGRMSFFFSSEEMRLRTGEDFENKEDLVHLPEKEIAESNFDKANGMLNFKLKEKNIEIPKKKSNNQQDYVVKLGDPFDYTKDFANLFGGGGDDGGGLTLLKVRFRWIQTKEKKDGIDNWTPTFNEVIKDKAQYEQTIVEATTSFPPLKSNGFKDDEFNAGEKLKSTVINGNKEVYFNTALWLRIMDDQDKVVDMVPACLQDDEIQNEMKIGENFDGAFGKNPDGAFPLFKFKNNIKFRFSIDEFERIVEENSDLGKLEGKSAIVADPRYNYAPEEWFYLDSELSASEWISHNQTGEDYRDRDIFMATSDAGYLQSIYELAFLPRLTDLKGDTEQGATENYHGRPWHDKNDIVNDFKDTRNHDLAWRTYDPFRNEDSRGNKQAFKDLPFVNEGNGFKVNPYSDSVNVLMSVFANTPLGWSQASTNKIKGAKTDYSSMDLEEFNKKYAFNAYTSDQQAKIRWETLEGVARKMIAEIKDSNQGGRTNTWDNVFLDDLGWTDNDDESFLGVETKGDSNFKLWDVDKKFLYGFWKDCFAVKQQLFLVFVRAEPTMMGSGASGHAPPQLGGKAVALVWRDPTPNPSSSESKDSRKTIPHKTRVLFYRQFE